MPILNTIRKDIIATIHEKIDAYCKCKTHIEYFMLEPNKLVPIWIPNFSPVYSRMIFNYGIAKFTWTRHGKNIRIKNPYFAEPQKVNG